MLSINWTCRYRGDFSVINDHDGVRVIENEMKSVS